MFKKLQIPFREQWAARVICQRGAAAMFGDTDLPLALIMEEILGWEKKETESEEKEEENEKKKEVLTTRNNL